MGSRREKTKTRKKNQPNSYGTFKRHWVPILGRDGSSPKRYRLLWRRFSSARLWRGLTAAPCSVQLPKQEPSLWTALEAARPGEDLSQALPQVSHKRWRSTLSPCFTLPDSPIFLITMNQCKGNSLRRKPFICAIQLLMLLSGEQPREPPQPPALCDFPTKNELFCVQTLSVFISLFLPEFRMFEEVQSWRKDSTLHLGCI